MAIGTKGIATAIGKDTAQFFLCEHNESGTGVFNDFFLTTSKVANILNIGEIARTFQQVTVSPLDVDSYNLQGPKEPTTVDFSLAVIAGQVADFETWWEERKQLDWGVAYFDVTGKVLLAFGGTANLASATLAAAEAGAIVQYNAQLNLQTIANFSDQTITPGGVEPAGG